MKIWFGHDAGGVLRSIEVHYGGWPQHVNFNVHGVDGTVDKLRASRLKDGITGYISVDCDCSPTESTCGCHNEIMAGNYVVNGQLVAKPPTETLINGAPADPVTISASPFTVQVTGPPDGQVGQLSINRLTGPEMVELTFSGGVSQIITVTFPGASCDVMAIGKLIRTSRIRVIKP